MTETTTIQICPDCHRVWDADREICTCGVMGFEQVTLSAAPTDE